MPLYLDEIWLEWNSAEQAKQVLTQFRSMARGDFVYPDGVALKGGPWLSNEEAKVVIILDIPDHAKTFPMFGLAMAHNLVKRRRLTPIVEWSAVDELIGRL